MIRANSWHSPPAVRAPPPSPLVNRLETVPPGTNASGFQAYNTTTDASQHAQRQTFLKPESRHSSTGDSSQFYASPPPGTTWPEANIHPSRHPPSGFLRSDLLGPYVRTGSQGNQGVPVPPATQPLRYSQTFIYPLEPQAVLPSSHPNLYNLNAYPPAEYPLTNMSDGSNEIGVTTTAQMLPILDPNLPDAPPTGPEGVSEDPESPVDVDNSGFSPRRGFTHKRAEDPPRNGEGKMVCKFTTTCGGLIFERRCEWR